MALSEVDTVSSFGRVRMPRVLVIEASGPFLEMQQQSADAIRSDFGVDPVFIRYSAAGGADTKTVAEIVDFVKDPKNGIDMVLTGNVLNSTYFGEQIAMALKQGEEPFKGPVAIQMNGAPYSADVEAAKRAGAIGMYYRGALEGPYSPYLALLDAYHTQQKGLGS